MKSIAIIFILFIPLVSSAQRIEVQALIGVTDNGEEIKVDANGAANFYTAANQPARVGMSGNITLFERIYSERYYDEAVRYQPWWAPNGEWHGVITYDGYAGSCYTAAVVAQSSTIKETKYSEKRCTAERTREPHGYTLCPLILDLNGEGIGTTGTEAPVEFMDVDWDGAADATGWTNPTTEEAFLWLDLSGNQRVDAGELFGTAMPLPSGGTARNGYEALGTYDLAQYGGNADGVIDKSDSIWGRLLLWVDRDHDGRSHHSEIRTLGAEHITQLSLARHTVHMVDGRSNILMFVGSYKKYLNASARHELVTRRMADILFRDIEE